jgi:hypothetical protein
MEKRKGLFRALSFPFRIDSRGANAFRDFGQFLFDLCLILCELRLLCLHFFDQREKFLFLVRIRCLSGTK